MAFDPWPLVPIVGPRQIARMSGIIDLTCTCGARYRVPDRLAGKNAKCKRCGSEVSIPGPAEPEDAIEVVEEDEPIAVIAQRRDAIVISGQQVAARAHSSAPGRAQPRTASAAGAFFRDCLWSVAFIAEPGSVAPFLVVAAIAALQPVLGFAMMVGGIARFIVKGWLYSFLFNVILQAANGERELPELALTEGLADTVLVPFFKFLASWAIAMLPALIYTMAIKVDPTLRQAGDPVFYLLLAGGAFMWPMTILVVAIGGVSSFARPDLIVLTIARTLGPYLFTCVMTAGALATAWFLSIELARAGSGSHPIALRCVLEVVELYFQVVVMRVIGLYYHHFKNRFAWSWG